MVSPSRPNIRRNGVFTPKLVVERQDVPALPDCAVQCIAATGCELTNPTCLCAETTISQLTTCVIGSCGADAAGQLAELAQSGCAGVPTASASDSSSTIDDEPTETSSNEEAEPTESTTDPTPNSTSPPNSSGVGAASGSGSGPKISASNAAGIAIGVIIALAIFALVAFILIKRRRKRKTSGSGEATVASPIPELDDSGGEQKARVGPQEMEITPVIKGTAELDTHRNPSNIQELDASPIPSSHAHELEHRIEYTTSPGPQSTPYIRSDQASPTGLSASPTVAVPAHPVREESGSPSGQRLDVERQSDFLPEPLGLQEAPSAVSQLPGQGESSGLEVVDEYEAMRREHAKLESRRRTLQELKDVEERQQALLERMERLKPGGPSAR